VEFETKGTTSSSVSHFVKDIEAKKAGAPPVFFRFGTIMVLQKPGGSHSSKLHLCDDEPGEDAAPPPQENPVQHYLKVMEYILDTRLYNQIAGPPPLATQQRPRKIERPFFGRYHVQGLDFVGEYFDHRLALHLLGAADGSSEESLDRAFHRLTDRVGRTKIFIGLRRDIFDAVVGERGTDALKSIDSSPRSLLEGSHQEQFLDTDGILVVVSREGKDAQIEEQFGEREVRRRLSLALRRQFGRAPQCGEPCRSREKEGKPCAIRTYRGTCHFHG
jgi:hypothetical protein